MRKILSTLVAAFMLMALLGSPARAGSVAADEIPATAPEARTVELAICLDTSGSMRGLIDAARQKLWVIVNDLATAEPMPRFRLALLTFGNDGHDAQSGWVKVETPFTEDLDLVSEKLFALTTNGGTEYVGRVLQSAHEQLEWDPSADTLKLIFVAGNESADQDPSVMLPDICKTIIESGVMVNSIYCGNTADGIAPGWRQVAMLADGHYAAIDHNSGNFEIQTPFDQQLLDLNESLNATYIPFGADGARGKENQVRQDANAIGCGSGASRATTKGGGQYTCAWDLVDALAAEKVKLEDLKEEELPAAMRELNGEERKAYVEERKNRRTEVKKQMAEASDRRSKFVAEEQRKRALESGASFDAAVRAAIRDQAAQKGFRFQELAPLPAPKKIGEKPEDGC